MTYKTEFPLVYIKFWDHSCGPADTNAPILCEVFGILRNQDELAYNVCSWICGEDLNEENTDMYCILKSTVIEFKEIHSGSTNHEQV